MEIILTHEQADFDAAGSVLAAWLLDTSRVPILPKRQNRNLAAFLNDCKTEFPFYTWRNAPKDKVSRILITDTQVIGPHSRTEGVDDVIVWDHHPCRHVFPDRDENIYEHTGACTTFLVEKLGRIPGMRLGRIFATLMLMGIYEDTGFLSYGTTTSRDIRAAAWLVDHGADTDLLRRYVLTPFTEHQQMACDLLMRSCVSYEIRGRQIVIASADVREISDEFSAVAHRMRDLLSPDGLLLLLCTKTGLRLICRGTTDDIDFGGLMKAFSGGGHVRAASALVPIADPENMDPDAEIIKVRDEILRLLPEHIRSDTPNLWQTLTEKLPPNLLTFVIRASEAAEKLKMPVYIVGGVVRDLLLDRPMMDLDIVTEGDAAALGEMLVSSFGGKLTVHRQFMTARWEPGDGTPLDLISARAERYAAPAALPEVRPGTIEDDLRRRDFTLNTLAVRLDGAHRGEVLDRCGGMADLRHGLIRTLHDRSFIDDPTRIFRAIRFEQRFGFTLEEDTLRQLREQSGGIAELTGQRIWHELRLYCAEPFPEKAFSRIAELGIAGKISEELVWGPETEAECVRFRTAQADPCLTESDGPELRIVAEEGPLWVWLSSLAAETAEKLGCRLLLSKQSLRGIRQTALLRSGLGQYIGRPASEAAFFLDNFAPGPLICYFRFCASEAEKTLIRKYMECWRHVVPELTGDDVLRSGLSAGPEIRELLRSLRAGRIDGTIRSKEDELLRLRQAGRKDL